LARTRGAGEARTIGREAWISAAIGALSSNGVEGVRVELLARKLGITKGSFYHHFRDRDELHAAMLEHWRRHMVIEVMEDLERIADPRARFHRMMRLTLDDSRADLEVELAVRLWARRDARVQAALEEVDALRIDYVMGVVVACGVPAAEARARAVLVFAYLRATPDVDEAVLAQCERLLVGV
jgi:AcrR family transcriptional regulator